MLRYSDLVATFDGQESVHTKQIDKVCVVLQQDPFANASISD
jgi:hypothetical protein